MTYLELIILYCLKAFNGERSIYAIYHLLSGKKSSQTIYDSKLYRLTALFGVARNISRSGLERAAVHLLENKTIYETEAGKYLLSEKGERELDAFLASGKLPSGLDGWRCRDLAPQFWRRLSLVVQTLSNLVHDTSVFVPIQRDEDLLKWAKQFLLSGSLGRKEFAEKVFEECQSVLERLSILQANIVVWKLSGYGRIGLTTEQISSQIGKEPLEVDFLFQSALHQILGDILEKQSQYPILSRLAEVPGEGLNLTNSTVRTYELLLSGKELDEIASLRRLKVSTIEDHVVEIIHNIPDFPIDSFVPRNLQEVLEKKIGELKTRKLKTIKESLEEETSYFQIRIMLAKCGDMSEADE